MKRKPMTAAEERLLKAAENWHYFTSIQVNGRRMDTDGLLHRAVEAAVKERSKK